MTRLLDLFGSELARLSGGTLLEAVRASEGRVVLAEVIAPAPPLLEGTSNVELVGAFGADLVCLNLIDPAASGALVAGLEGVKPQPESFAALARLLGRPVGLNLEPDVPTVPAAYRATDEHARAAAARGAAFVVVTANPGRGITSADVEVAVKVVRNAAPDLVCFAGKMHGAGTTERLDASVAHALIDAGASGVLVPLPGTVPGLTERDAAAIVAAVHDHGTLAVGTIGTSQEGADEQTMRTLALTAKRIGVDVHHLGDGGYTGVARPENVYAYSVAIRGVRHTWNRMARAVRASWDEGGW